MLQFVNELGLAGSRVRCSKLTEIGWYKSRLVTVLLRRINRREVMYPLAMDYTLEAIVALVAIVFFGLFCGRRGRDAGY